MAKSLLTLGYGTLLYKASAYATLQGNSLYHECIPVRVSGLKRVFDVRPDHYEASSVLHGLPKGCAEAGAMNVVIDMDCAINGVVFEVTEDESSHLHRRERYYDSEFFQVHEFSSGEPMGSARCYICRDHSPWVENDVAKLMPLWRDIQWARTGAYGISDEFGFFFDETTFLANGTTLVVDAYRDLLGRRRPQEPPKAPVNARESALGQVAYSSRVGRLRT